MNTAAQVYNIRPLTGRHSTPSQRGELQCRCVGSCERRQQDGTCLAMSWMVPSRNLVFSASRGTCRGRGLMVSSEQHDRALCLLMSDMASLSSRQASQQVQRRVSKPPAAVFASSAS